MRFAIALLAACAPFVLAGCGKEGPPLPPLRLVPAPVAESTARRTASQVELRFVLPTRNQNGQGPIDLQKVEIFAITVGPGAPPPTNRDLMSTPRLVGTIEVRPAPEEDAPVKEDPADKRPGPGDAVSFAEELTPEKLTPRVETPPDKEAPQESKTAKAAPDSPAYPQRIYAVRGVTRSGRPGPPAPRLAVPLVDPAAAPAGLDVQYDERTFVVTWLPPVASPADEPGAEAIAFNVYGGGGSTPLNAAPIVETRFEHGPVRFGTDQCFLVRSVRTVQNVRIESGPSEPRCVSTRDTFPPAAPKGLQGIAGTEGISLSWDANTEEDFAGYIVLRGEAPDETLQALTEPIRDTNYRDTAVKPGVTYVYRLVAVDKAAPPNTSAQSEPARVTAR